MKMLIKKHTFVNMWAGNSGQVSKKLKMITFCLVLLVIPFKYCVDISIKIINVKVIGNVSKFLKKYWLLCKC